MNNDILWETIKKYKHIYDILALFDEHLKLLSVINNLQKNYPADTSIVSNLQDKYRNELEIVKKMKKVKINDDDLNYIDKLKRLDDDLSYVALNKLFQGKANDLLEKWINSNNDNRYDIFQEIITYLANNNPYVNA